MLAALALGLAGLPHCGAMCAAPCMAACRPGPGLPASASSVLVLQIGRLMGYAVLGAIAAQSVGFARLAASHVEALRPLWLMLQMALLICGVWLLLRGAVPRWMDHLTPAAAWPARWANRLSAKSGRWPAGVRSALVGVAWAVLPCAQLYAAVLVAALAPDAAGGAAVMVVFGLPAAALFAGLPTAWGWWKRRVAASASESPVHIIRRGWRHRLSRWAVAPELPIRLAGAALALSAAALIVHAAVRPVAAWC